MNLDSLQYLMAMGFRGKLDDLGVNTLETYEAKDRAIRESGKGHPLFTPIVEINPRQQPKLVCAKNIKELASIVQEGYAALCQGNPEIFYPGPFGDFIQVFKSGIGQYAFTVGHKSFLKPGLAADLAVVVKTPAESGQYNDYCLITGIRKSPPGQGQPALFGGFRNIERDAGGIFHFDSGVYTLLHEAIEEAGLKIEHDNPGYLKTAYTLPAVQVEITLGKTKHTCIMYYLDTIPTSDNTIKMGGETLPNGEKRVYATDAYMVVVNLDLHVDADYLQSVLCGGDDIDSLEIFNITREVTANDPQSLQNRIGFGIDHHNYFLPLVIKKIHELEKASLQGLSSGY